MYVLFDIDIRLFVKISFNFCSLSYKIDCVTADIAEFASIRINRVAFAVLDDCYLLSICISCVEDE